MPQHTDVNEDHIPDCGIDQLEEAGLAVGAESHTTHLYRAAVCFEKDGQLGSAVAIFDALIVLYTNKLQSSWALNKTAQLYESMGLFDKAASAYERHTQVAVNDRPDLLQMAVTIRLALEQDQEAEADTRLLVKMFQESGQTDRAAEAVLALAPVFHRRGVAAERQYLREYVRRFSRSSSKITIAALKERLAELRWGENQEWRKVFLVGYDRTGQRPPSSATRDVWAPVFLVSPITSRANLME